MANHKVRLTPGQAAIVLPNGVTIDRNETVVVNAKMFEVLQPFITRQQVEFLGDTTERATQAEGTDQGPDLGTVEGPGSIEVGGTGAALVDPGPGQLIAIATFNGLGRNLPDAIEPTYPPGVMNDTAQQETFENFGEGIRCVRPGLYSFQTQAMLFDATGSTEGSQLTVVVSVADTNAQIARIPVTVGAGDPQAGMIEVAPSGGPFVVYLREGDVFNVSTIGGAHMGSFVTLVFDIYPLGYYPVATGGGEEPFPDDL